MTEDTPKTPQKFDFKDIETLQRYLNSQGKLWSPRLRPSLSVFFFFWVGENRCALLRRLAPLTPLLRLLVSGGLLLGDPETQRAHAHALLLRHPRTEHRDLRGFRCRGGRLRGLGRCGGRRRGLGHRGNGGRRSRLLLGRGSRRRLGSGSGRDCYALAQLVGAKGIVTGVDMTEEQLDVARRHVDAFTKDVLKLDKPNMAFLHGYIEDLAAAGVKPNSQDLVISNCVVNLSPNKAAVLQGVYDVLKEGGAFLRRTEKALPVCVCVCVCV